MNRILLSMLDEDSGGVRHNVPNMRYEKWEINALGFRGKEIDLKKKEGQVRVVCLGGSESFGVYESKDKEWPSQLGELLRPQFPRVEVINASVAGLILKKKKEYVEKYVLPLEPNILILIQGTLLAIKDSMKGVESEPGVEKGEGKRRNQSKKGSISYGRVLPKLGEAVKRCLPNGLLTPVSLWMLRQKIRRKEKRHLVNKKPLDTVPEHVLLAFERDLRLFVQYLKENHIVPVLSTYPNLPTPSNKDLYKNILLSIRRLSFELSEEGIIDGSRRVNEVVKRIAEEQNLAFVDNDHLMPKTLEYFIDYSHYTDKGAELIAKNFYSVLNHCKLIE